MSAYRGKVLYIVNVASHCGYTASNYAAFKSLAKHRDNGFEILLAPCNQVQLSCNRMMLSNLLVELPVYSYYCLDCFSSATKSLVTAVPLLRSRPNRNSKVWFSPKATSMARVPDLYSHTLRMWPEKERLTGKKSVLLTVLFFTVDVSTAIMNVWCSLSDIFTI